MSELPQLNRLSCVRCKDRKVRCNRIMPTCDKCEGHQVQCVYPERVKRRITKPPQQPLITNDALSTILERLQRVEEHVVQPQQHISPASTAKSPYDIHSSLQEDVSSVSSPAGVSTRSGGLTPVSRWHVAHAASPTILDATAILKDATDEVQKRTLRSLSQSVITDEIRIPADRAKLWVKNYFDQMPRDMFLSLINRKLIEMIPDLLEMPHVHLDSCMLVIYYGVLHHGSAVAAEDERQAQKADTWHSQAIGATRAAYIGCLRAVPGWQREATGTITDLIAAVTMVRVCGEGFDYEMAWEMYKLACDYAQGLGLHNLDGVDGATGIHQPDISDEDRQGFWELIQLDAFFRLIFNKPPSITGNAWKVNLPWLDPSSGGVPQTEQSMIFLISSRITLVLVRFFSMMEDIHGDVRDVLLKAEELGREIIDLFKAWNLDKLNRNSNDARSNNWLIADVALIGYTAVIFMLRKAATVGMDSPEPISTDHDVPQSPLALEAASRIVEVSNWLFGLYQYPGTFSYVFGAFRTYVPIGYLVRTILNAPDVTPFLKDIEELEALGSHAASIARVGTDFMPFARAVQSLVSELRRKVDGR